MGIRQQQQALQSGALGIQKQQLEMPTSANAGQMAQQEQSERAAVTQMMQSGKDDKGNSVLNQNGEPDPSIVLPALGRMAPLTGQQYAQNILKTITAKVGLQSAATNLDSTQKAALMGPIQTLALNPTDEQIGEVNSTLDQWGQQHPEMAPNVAQAKFLVSHIQSVQDDPAKRSEMANKLGGLLQGGQAVQTQPQTGLVDKGGQIQPVTINPAVAGGGVTSAGAPIDKSIPPSTQVFTDSRTGNTYALDPRDPSRTILVGQGTKLRTNDTSQTAPQQDVRGGTFDEQSQGTRDAILADIKKTGATNPTVNGAALDSGQRSSAPPNMTVGEAGQVTSNTENVTATRKVAAEAQIQHDILNRIQSLAATPGMYLGPGSENVGKLATVVGQIPGFEGAAKYANNYNELVKFMAQNAARQGQSMGLSGSDSRLDMATHAQPNANPMDPRTVQNVAQYMGGIVRMGLAKADAMDKWLQQPGNSLQNEHQFERQWRDNADPRLFQLAEMNDQGSAADYARLHIRKGETDALAKKHDWLTSVGALP